MLNMLLEAKDLSCPLCKVAIESPAQLVTTRQSKLLAKEIALKFPAASADRTRRSKLQRGLLLRQWKKYIEEADESEGSEAESGEPEWDNERGEREEVELEELEELDSVQRCWSEQLLAQVAVTAVFLALALFFG
jgi:hypothetical protein